MPAVFDSLKPMSFAGIAFPYQDLKVSGGLRDHVHSFPHVAGGAPEKLGRKLYDIQVTAHMQAGLAVPKWGHLWPDGVSSLRALFEDQTTEKLHIPILGTIDAYCLAWVESSKAGNLSGTVYDLTFREDQTTAFLTAEQVAASTTDYAAALSALHDVPKTGLDQTGLDLFDAIAASGDAVLAIKDQADLYGALAASKIRSLTRLCSEADRQVNDLEQPAAMDIVDALHDLWYAAVKLQQDAQSRLVQLQQYTTPLVMTIQAVARALGIENPADVMQLNAILNPLAIPAGTVLNYYAQQAA